MSEISTALGLMSGTSLDGIDAAILRTDGGANVETGPSITIAYEDGLRERLRGILGGAAPEAEVAAVERDFTRAHGEAVARLLASAGSGPADIDVIGFHGHTIAHEPAAGRTWQIGDGAALAAQAGIDVVCDFRAADVAAGGQGAPLAPLYHAALAPAEPRPLAVLNVGGVANVTWIGEAFDAAVAAPPPFGLVAFDTGPGNALMDDWVRAGTGQRYDRDGALARAGTVDAAALAALLDDPYFDRAPPKSLDRDAFDPAPISALSVADGAATLCAFTVASVARAAGHFPDPARRWIVTGGGRHNPTIMRALARALDADMAPAERLGWDGDALEAQAFAYLAVRSLAGLPLSLPGTTGAPRPLTGGRLHRAPK